jgi:hypothetical protein
MSKENKAKLELLKLKTFLVRELAKGTFAINTQELLAKINATLAEVEKEG